MDENLVLIKSILPVAVIMVNDGEKSTQYELKPNQRMSISQGLNLQWMATDDLPEENPKSIVVKVEKNG